MADSSPRIPIIVAIVGLIGVLGAAVINNWDKLTGQRTPPDSSGTTSTAGPTTSTAGPTTSTAGTGSSTTTPAGPDNNPGRPGKACAAPSATQGDEILDFHVVQLQGTKIVIKANYHISPAHERVMIGAWLKPNGSGYTPTFTPPKTDWVGGAELEMVATPGQSETIEIFMYEEGRPSEPFACWVFPYRMSFQ